MIMIVKTPGCQICATDQGSDVLVFNTIAVRDVDRDDMFDSVTGTVTVGTSVNVAMNPVMPNNVDARTLVLTAVADDNILMEYDGEDGIGKTTLLILKVAHDMNTSVAAAILIEDHRPRDHEKLIDFERCDLDRNATIATVNCIPTTNLGCDWSLTRPRANLTDCDLEGHETFILSSRSPMVNPGCTWPVFEIRARTISPDMTNLVLLPVDTHISMTNPYSTREFTDIRMLDRTPCSVIAGPTIASNYSGITSTVTSHVCDPSTRSNWTSNANIIGLFLCIIMVKRTVERKQTQSQHNVQHVRECSNSTVSTGPQASVDCEHVGTKLYKIKNLTQDNCLFEAIVSLSSTHCNGLELRQITIQHTNRVLQSNVPVASPIRRAIVSAYTAPDTLIGTANQ